MDLSKERKLKRVRKIINASIDGKKIDGKGNEIAVIIASKKIGDVVTISLWRNGKTLEIKATLAPAPNQ